MDEDTRFFAEKYLNNANTPEAEKYWDYIRLAMMSSANTCIIQAQDLLGLGEEARINIPSTLGNNWKWRIDSTMLTKEAMDKIYDIAIYSDRLSYRCQHLEWVKREEKRKALEEAKAEAKALEEAKAKAEAEAITKTTAKAKAETGAKAEAKKTKKK